jgi:hypothetical protein
MNLKTLLFAILLLPAGARGEVVVAPATDALLQFNHTEELAKWADQIDRMNQSLQKLDQQLQTLNRVKEVIGDPTQIAGLVGLGELTDSLQNSGIGKLSASIAQTADSLQTLKETGQGLYQTIPATLTDGTSILRDLPGYRKFSAIEKSKQNFDSVFDEAVSEIKKLDSDIQSTASQLRNASTQAEVDKLNAKLNALHSAKDSWEGRKRDATNQLWAQKIANDNDREKQEKAAGENAEADRSSALDKLSNSKIR